jgi:hypothetical protein
MFEKYPYDLFSFFSITIFFLCFVVDFIFYLWYLFIYLFIYLFYVYYNNNIMHLKLEYYFSKSRILWNIIL